MILPKSIREAVGIEEGDTVRVEVGDGITLLPVKKVDKVKLLRSLERHRREMTSLETIEPIVGELADIDLEEEFEERGS